MMNVWYLHMYQVKKLTAVLFSTFEVVITGKVMLTHSAFLLSSTPFKK